MPFHYRLLGKERMILFSFIHSMNTSFGKSIYEPVAEILCSQNFPEVKAQFSLGNEINTEADSVINEIINKLSSGEGQPKAKEEIDKIRKACSGSREVTKLKTVKADLLIRDTNGKIYLFDIKTVKPNKSSFKDLKRTLLQWAAMLLTKDQNLNIETCLAIPYNPYDPKAYERWTMAGMIDTRNELKVQEEFWDFIAKKGGYEKLLDIFEEAGKNLRTEIDQHFTRYQ